MRVPTLPFALLLLFVLANLKTVVGQSEPLQRYDIVISEIMAAPSPAIGLPDAEYVELHSRRPVPCVLSGWKLQIGSVRKSLPEIRLDSCGYAIVVATKNKDLFERIPIQVCTVSSLSITDGGQTLVLYDNNDEAVHAVAFKRKWHTESIKQSGGWSLEMKDENLPCHSSGNWDSSVAPEGGTPGAPNSIRCVSEDYVSPFIERVTLIDSMTLRVFLSEPVRPTFPLAPRDFTIAPDATIVQVSEVPPFFTALDLSLSQPLQPGTVYKVCLPPAVCDCAGNAVACPDCISCGIAEKPQPFDLVINEVLSHAKDGADADFIEVYNRSSRIIDLKEVKIGSGGDTIPKKAVVAASQGLQLMPQGYCALCKNKALTMSQYDCPDHNALYDCDSLPSFAAESGVVFLTDRSLRTIDRFSYSEDMHYPKLLTTAGVSLERVSPSLVTQRSDNWHSASSTAGFATPGFRNSQASNETAATGLAVSPAVISPDNDGFEDYAEISVSMPAGENRLSVRIFNQYGFLVRHLVNNELCSQEALFRWDGTDDQKQTVPSGMYVVTVQYWNLDGKSRRFKKVVSVR